MFDFLLFHIANSPGHHCLSGYAQRTHYDSGWWFGPFVIFHFIYGMSSFPLTNAYFSRWLKPPTSYMSLYYKLFLFFFPACSPFCLIVLVIQFRDCWTPASIFATQKVTNGERMGCFSCRAYRIQARNTSYQSAIASFISIYGFYNPIYNYKWFLGS